MCTARGSGIFYQLPNTTSAIIFHPTMLLVLGTSRTLATGQYRELTSELMLIAVMYSIRYRYVVSACHYVL